MRLLLLLYSLTLLLPALGQAATYGPANEPCHTDGTLLTLANWELELEKAVPGKYKLPAASSGSPLVPSGGVVVINPGTSESNRVVVVPNCPSGTPVTTFIRGKVQLNSYTTLVGTNHRCTTEAPNAGCVTMPASSGTWSESPIVRNVDILVTGTAPNSHALVIDRGVRSPTISGSLINNESIGGNTNTIYVNRLTSGKQPAQNIQLLNNRIRQNVASTSGDGQCTMFVSDGPTIPGDWAGPNNLIEGNLYEDCLDGPAPGIDVKPAGAPGARLTIRKNTFNAASWTGGACILIQNQTPTGTEVIIEENIFNWCDDHTAITLGNLGGAAEYNAWKVTVKNNVFNHKATTWGALYNQFENTVFINNSIYGGRIRQGGTYHNPSTLTFRNNIVSNAILENNGAVSNCTHNIFHSTTGSLGTCTDTQTGDPLFTNTATGNLTLSSISSPAVNNGTNVGLACNGSSCTIGAFDPMRFTPTTGGEVGSVNPQTTTLTFTTTTQILPATGCTGFTRQEENPATVWNNLAITSCDRQGTGQVKLVHATATGGRNQRVSYSGTGNLTDSALRGNTLNQPRPAIVNAAITNNVGGAPPSSGLVQSKFRVYRVPLLAGTLDALTPIGIRGAVIQTGYVLMAAQIDCSGTCPSTGAKAQGSWNLMDWFDLNDGTIMYVFDQAGGYLEDEAGGLILAEGGFSSDDVAFVGLTELSGSQYPQQGQIIPGCLDATGLTATDKGAVQRTAAAVPTFELNNKECLTMAALVKLNRIITPGVEASVLRVRWVDQTGTPFASSVPVEATVVDNQLGVGF